MTIVQVEPDTECQPSESIARPIKATEEATWYAVGFESPEDRLTDRNKYFWIRLVMPRDPFLGPDLKPRSVIVMLNGLAEAGIRPYDELMLDLARRRLPSILLPLPNHFSRYSDENEATPFQIDRWDTDPFSIPEEDRPTEMQRLSKTLVERLSDDPQVWFDGYRQTMKDLEHLTSRILTYRRSSTNEDPLTDFFSPRTRLSLYGYSLGGLITACMMLRQPHRVHSAFLVNTGASLNDVNASFIFHDKWPTIQSRIEEADSSSLEPYEEEFRLVFLRKEPEDQIEYRKRLHRISRRTLFLLGANDDVFPYEEVVKLKPPEGLTHIVLPAIGHRIGHGPKKDEWQRWRKFVAGLISVFEDSHAPDNPLDAAADGLAVDLERLSSRERIRVKIALWSKSEEKLLPCGVSMNMKHEWEVAAQFQATRGFCLEVFQAKTSKLESQDFSRLKSGSYGFKRAEIETYLSIGVKAVLCIKIGKIKSSRAKGPSHAGVLVVTSNCNLNTSILQGSYASERIEEIANSVSAHISTWKEVERLLEDSTSRVRWRNEPI